MQLSVAESELSARLVFSREAVAGHGKLNLTRGKDWHKARRVIVYAEKGVERLFQVVGVLMPPDEKESLTAPSNGHSEEMLTFIQGRFPNRRIIKARRPKGVEVYVRVRSSENFRSTNHQGEPMQFPARQENGVWVIARAWPRRPGKW
jgi:hypothetical protein